MNDSSSKTIVKNSVIYTASGLLLKCFSFFLLPLYTAYLTTSDYGITSIVNSFISTMSFIVALSVFAAVTRFYVEYRDEPNSLKRFYGSVIVFTYISGCIWFGIMFFFRKQLSSKVFSGEPFWPIICISIISLVFNCQTTIYNNILMGQQKAGKVSIINLAYFFASFLFNLLFVVVLKYGAIGVILSTAIVNFLYTVFFTIDLLRTNSIVFCIDCKILKEVLKYSIPLIPHNLSTSIALLISKILIGESGTLSAVGVYTVATQFANVADTVQGYVNTAYGPWLFEKLHDKKEGYKDDIRKVVCLLTSVIGLFFVALTLFSHDCVLVLNRAYVDAWTYIPFIVFVYTLKTAYYFYVSILFYHKKASRLLFIATLSGSIVNIVLSYIIIPVWGVYGSIVADGLSTLIRTLIVIIISYRYEDIGLRIRDFIINLAIVTFFIAIGLVPSFVYFKDTFNVYNLFYKCLVLFVFIAIIAIRYRRQIPGIIASLKQRKHK